MKAITGEPAILIFLAAAWAGSFSCTVALIGTRLAFAPLAFLLLPPIFLTLGYWEAEDQIDYLRDLITGSLRAPWMTGR